MSPPLLGVEGGGQGNVSLLVSSSSMDSISQTEIKERNYLGLSDCSSLGSSTSILENKNNLNLKATELRLGLPGSQSPVRDPEFSQPSSGKLDEKPFFPLVPSKDGVCSLQQKTIVQSNKRGFADTIDEMKSSLFTEGNWMFNSTGSESEVPKYVGQGKLSDSTGINAMKEGTSKGSKELPHAANGTGLNKMIGSNNGIAPAAKAQVIGWPPVRSFRKNTLATSSKNNEEVDGKPGPGALFVKVSMDGAPYLRKVDLRSYSTYPELSSALEKMFTCFTIGQCGSQGARGREILSESKLRDLLHGSEYVLTYEDKDGDWMLVGDVPWEMFIGSCKRLKIMKGSDAIGLAPRAMEKSKNRN
ncbi:hypothetical protein LguiB_019292 [Lonicera macranthoides]